MLFSMVQSRGGTLRKCDWGSRNPIARALSSKNVISRPRKKNSTMTSAQFHGRIFTNHWNQYLWLPPHFRILPFLTSDNAELNLNSLRLWNSRPSTITAKLGILWNRHHPSELDAITTLPHPWNFARSFITLWITCGLIFMAEKWVNIYKLCVHSFQYYQLIN